MRYYTDAEDMLFDLERSDADSAGKINAASKTIILLMAQQFGRSAAQIASAMNLDRTQTERVLEEVYSYASSPR